MGYALGRPVDIEVGPQERVCQMNILADFPSKSYWFNPYFLISKLSFLEA